MNTRKAIITLGLVLGSLVMLPVAHADAWDQASKLTFSQSVQIPGTRLARRGTYWFVLADSVSNRNIVQVFNSDRSTLYATILTIDSDRLQPTDSTTITFAERESMPANAIVTWFYPGRKSGREFVYSRSEGRELARAKQQTVIAMEPSKHQSAVGGA